VEVVIDKRDSYNFEWEISKENSISLHFRLTSPKANVWRIQSSFNNEFDECGAVQLLRKEFNEPLAEDLLPLEVKDFPSGLQIKNSVSDISIRFDLSPFRISILDNKGNVRCVIDDVSFDRDSITITGTLKDEEFVYGLGQRFNGANQRGKAIHIWSEDRWCQTEGNSYVPIPLFLSTEGYGVFVNRYELSSFDLGKEKSDKWKITLKDSPLDLYLFTEDSPKEILKDYAELSGFSPMPPEWSFGIFVCRHLRLKEFATPDGIREMVKKMEENDLPWTVVIIEGWDAYDTSTYKDLKEIVDELHQKGKKVLVYERCGRLDKRYWEEHKAKDEFFVRDKNGNTLIEEAPLFNPVDAPNRKMSCFLDITNPEALDWWQNFVWKRLLVDIGIDGAKIDFGEEFPEDEDIVLFSGRSVKGMHQYYPVKYSTMMYRLYQRMRPEGGICWARGGGIGAQRYPYIWCGDQLREFRFLKAILSAILSSGLSGIPFMCHDLAGYMPTRDPELNDEKKVFIRGTELACFTVNMETHGTVTRPYDFPPDVVSIYRFYSKVHYALIPYLIEQARISCSTGVPLVRHLYLEFPEDKKVREIEDEYMLGDGLLVAPVLEDTDRRDIYIPEGRWRDLWENKEFVGPYELSAYPAPLERIPVFVSCYSRSAVLDKVIEDIKKIKLT